MLGKTIKYFDVAGEEQEGVVKGKWFANGINWLVVHREPDNKGCKYHQDYIQEFQIIEG
jgi:hypothetical protein